MPAREHEQVEQSDLYNEITLVRQLNDDPTNDTEAGLMRFEPGAHHDGTDYDVFNAVEDGHDFLKIRFETLIVVSLPEPMEQREAAEYAHEMISGTADAMGDSDE
ncbi:hypothetical protein [Halomarina rubra]|uniref:Uncharacterized protein n=1 Tax=Halomarina rubra TaxID=2071873 RepID=A0ABD6B1Z7_9EURY|nr:hypothetical protein [Halomarina rubra]